MSCHDIGRGMNNVVKNVLKLYDAEKIDVSVARKLIAVARDSVNYCDGNEDEAIEVMKHCRCGKCFKKFNTGDFCFILYNLFDWPAPERNQINPAMDPDETEDALATWEICDDCLESVINDIFKGSVYPEELKEKYINTHSAEDYTIE